MKEKYLISIKNAMFWHFTSSETRETLEEINTYFQSAIDSGGTEAGIIQEYGTPATFAKELLDGDAISRGKRKPVLFIKSLCLGIYTVFTLVSFLLLPLNAAFYIFTLCCPFAIWFLAGNNCILPVLENTAVKKQQFARIQVLTLLLFFLLQAASYFIIPAIASKGYIAGTGRLLSFIIYLLMLVLLLQALFFLKKMSGGNIYMFYIVIQDISITASLFLYLSFLKNAELPENLGFIFTPFFVSIPVLAGFWVYTDSIVKHAGTNNITR